MTKVLEGVFAVSLFSHSSILEFGRGHAYNQVFTPGIVRPLLQLQQRVTFILPPPQKYWLVADLGDEVCSDVLV